LGVLRSASLASAGLAHELGDQVASR
jgi:hypothetical protein